MRDKKRSDCLLLLLSSSFSSSSRGVRGRRRRGMSYLSTLPTSSSASSASSSSSSSSARFAFSRTKTHQNRKSTIKAAFSNRQRREKTAAVVVARGCGKAESEGSGTREVNRAKDDDEASSGASRRENAREENDEEEEDAFHQRHDASPFPESRDERPKRENALSSIGRRTVMSSAAFGAMTSGSSSITLLSFPDKAKATPRDIEWGAPGVTKRAFKFDVPLRVNVLRGTIPANVFEEFKETQASPRLKLQHSASASLAKSFQDLRRGKAILDDGGNINDLEEDGEASKENSRDRNSSDKKDKKKKKKMAKTAATATLATLGDAYLKAAIRENLILPFEVTGKERWFQALPDVYKNLCFRDYRTGDIVRSTDPNGRLYAVPYRVTATLLAYRADKLPRGMEAITDWTDVFDPRFGIKTFVGCADAPREILSAAMKMGNPKNTINPKTIDDERSQRDALRRLRAKIKVSDNETYLRALQNGDISVAFGGSDDVLALCRRSSLVTPVFPPSGTSLHCDVFVRPVLNEGGGYTSSVPNSAPSSSPGIDAWLDFILDSGRINKIGGLRAGLNPIQFDGDRIYGRRLSQDDVGDIFKGWLPDDLAWSNSEFVLPLSDAAIRAYEDISREI